MRNKGNEEAMLELDLSGVEGLLNTNLPSPDLLDFYQRLDEREIVWNSFIDDSMIDISMYVIAWNKEDAGLAADERKPIKIFINSDGGDPFVVMNLADVIALSVTPVVTIGMGRVYSAACMLFMAGHRRLTLPSTTFLLHDGSCGLKGDMAKIMDNLEFQKKYEEKYRKYVVENSRIPVEEMERNYRRDWFMFSDEAVLYGVADQVVRSLEEIM